MNSRSAAHNRIRFFFFYAALRLRLFLREILQLHQRFLIAFLYFFGLILSGNEQLALRQSLAHLVSPQPWVKADLVYLTCMLLYAWVVAAVVRFSARGGRVHYLAETFPLPFFWERIVRVMTLTLVNLTILFLWSLQKGTAWPWALLLGSAYYVFMLGLQLSLLEKNWRIFPLWILGAFLLMFSKGTLMLWPMLALTGILAFWSLRREESPAHDHPNLPIGSWETRCRAVITQHGPASLMMQITYTLAMPALILYCLLLTSALLTLLGMVLKQKVPDSQKIYVYTCITGFISILLSSFFRNFQDQRREKLNWIQSLPRDERWWLRQDTLFVALLYGLLTIPFSLALVLLHHLPGPVPCLILPVHALGFMVLRIMQRSRQREYGLLFLMGLSAWFILLAYLCDHGLRWATRVML